MTVVTELDLYYGKDNTEVTHLASALASAKPHGHAAATPGSAANTTAAHLCLELSLHSSCGVTDTSCCL